MQKICKGCNLEKDFSEFYAKSRFWKYPNSKAGYDSHCKKCILAEQSESLQLNPDKRRKSDRKQHLKRYNLTLESYNDMFLSQNGCCLGCYRHQSEFNRNFIVDHDHETGKVRGLLCLMCNSVIGYAQDNTTILSNLIKYLDSNNKPELADYNTNVVRVNFTKKVG